MRHFDLPKALLLALYADSVQAFVQDSHRVLRAAMSRSNLLKRDTRVVQKFESEVAYVEGLRVVLLVSHRADFWRKHRPAKQ